MNNQELVIIDAGHGGIDSGAVANNTEEKNLNLQAALQMYNRLQELGIPSVLVREDDEYLPKNDRVRRINTIAKEYPNSILISNHINAGGGEGAEVVYSLKNNSTFADLILNNIGEKGQIKRKAYQRRLPENPNKDYYYILRETNTKEPVLIEYGFIDNPKDIIKLQNNLDDYVEGVVEAITTYLDLPYESPELEKEYIVKRGDTLWSISRKTGISVDELKRLNNLTTDTLTIGQVLKLEEVGQIEGPIYIVQRNDTLWSIARKYGVSVQEIINANNLKTNVLTIGQQLIIPIKDSDIEEPPEPIIPPEPEPEPEPTPEPEPVPPTQDDYTIYTVQKGDSLWLISQRYGITVPELIDINNLQNLTIYVGQKLLVPKQEDDNTYYIVQSGDTLWSIANKNNMSVEELKNKNNLTSNLLTIGQQLIL